jgi:hypothetical protein
MRQSSAMRKCGSDRRGGSRDIYVECRVVWKGSVVCARRVTKYVWGRGAVQC